MLELGRVTKVKVLFLVLVFFFNFDLFKFSAAILEKGLLAWNIRVTLSIIQSEMKPKSARDKIACNLLRVLIGSLYCLCPLRLAREITLDLVLRHSA